jgi:integrative and conjugative element protein (TIGR02256 family)
MMEFQLGEKRIKFSSEVISKLTEYLQNDLGKPESGGILIGYSLETGDHSITDITVPGKGDRQSRYSFVRSVKRAQNILDMHFKKSKGKKIYLGEWHTHPEDNPHPSSIDKNSILERIRKDKIHSDTIFMVICGTEAIYIQKVKKSGLQESLYIPISVTNI